MNNTQDELLAKLAHAMMDDKFDNKLLHRLAAALISREDVKGLKKFLTSYPVDVTEANETTGGRNERLDEYAQRIGAKKTLQALRDAGAPVPGTKKLVAASSPKF